MENLKEKIKQYIELTYLSGKSGMSKYEVIEKTTDQILSLLRQELEGCVGDSRDLPFPNNGILGIGSNYKEFDRNVGYNQHR